MTVRPEREVADLDIVGGGIRWQAACCFTNLVVHSRRSFLPTLAFCVMPVIREEVGSPPRTSTGFCLNSVSYHIMARSLWTGSIFYSIVMARRLQAGSIFYSVNQEAQVMGTG